MESQRRTITKALTWRVVATSITACIAWAVTGEVRFGAFIGGLDALIKLVSYYAHERVWNRVDFGRARAPEYQI